MDTTTLIEAEALAESGFRVFPARNNDKRPAINAWPDAATCNLDTIKGWFGLSKVNLAVRCGQTDLDIAFFVVDIDIKNDQPGAESWANFCEQHPQVAEAASATVMSTTPSGGWHLWFTMPDNADIRNGRPWPGVDIRGEGGYVLAPPSNVNGDYEWVRDPWTHILREAPAALIEAVTHHEPARSEEPEAPRSVLDVSTLVNTPTTPVQTDDEPSVWYNLHQRDQSPHLLQQAGWQYSHQTGNTSQWTRPGKSVRQGTSASLHGDKGTFVVFTTEIPLVWAQTGKTNSGGQTVLTPFDLYCAIHHNGDEQAARSTIRRTMMPAPTVPTVTVPTQDALPAETVTEAAGTPTIPDANLGGRILDMLLTTEQLDQIEPPNPLVDGWLFQDSLAWLFGPSGSGKSFVAVDIAMHVGTGLAWHGHTVTKGKVLYMVAEGASGMLSRTRAWYEHHGKHPTDIHWLPTAVNMFAPLESAEMIEACRTLQPDLIIIDTLARASAGAEENSAKDAGQLIDNMDQLRTVSNGACVLMIHHSGKDTGQGGRGSSAFRGAVESEIAVDGGLTNLTVKNTKQKNIEHSPPKQFIGEHKPASNSIALINTNYIEPGSNEEITDLDIYQCLWDIHDGTTPVTAAAWAANVKERYEISRATFDRRKKHLLEHYDWIQVAKGGGKFIPLEPVNAGS